jgi:hypothetical protein
MDGEVATLRDKIIVDYQGGGVEGGGAPRQVHGERRQDVA